MSDERTTQLRRYRMVPGELDPFLDWWRGRCVPAREASGFRVEFAVAVAATDEFVWAVSAAGDEVAFTRLDAAWVASPERAVAFEGVPQRVASFDLQFAQTAQTA